jgi:hypothetical protein
MGLLRRAAVLALSGWMLLPSGNQRPVITKGDKEPVLVLPEPMQQALRKFDRDFRPRRLIDYPPWMWRPGCTTSPTCADGLYKHDVRAAPFAVAGFFDADNEMDVMIDGDNRTHGRRLALTTGPGGIVVTEVERLDRIPLAVAASRVVNGRWRTWGDGVDQSLSFVRADKYGSTEEAAPLDLKHDGVLVSRLNGRATIYYLQDAVWKRYIVAR